MIRGLSLAIAAAVMTTSAACVAREASLNEASTSDGLYDPTMDSAMFRAALEHARLRDGQVRVDPRLLLGWRDFQPHMSESPRELFQRRREILAELGIPETDAEHNNRCPLNPWATDYSACSAQGTFYGHAIGLPQQTPAGGPCRGSADERCVVEVVIQSISERSAARRVDHYWFRWDSSLDQWVLEEAINIYVT
jgi:hypothetical protein